MISLAYTRAFMRALRSDFQFYETYTPVGLPEAGAKSWQAKTTTKSFWPCKGLVLGSVTLSQNTVPFLLVSWPWLATAFPFLNAAQVESRLALDVKITALEELWSSHLVPSWWPRPCGCFAAKAEKLDRSAVGQSKLERWFTFSTVFLEYLQRFHWPICRLGSGRRPRQWQLQRLARWLCWPC